MRGTFDGICLLCLDFLPFAPFLHFVLPRPQRIKNLLATRLDRDVATSLGCAGKLGRLPVFSISSYSGGSVRREEIRFLPAQLLRFFLVYKNGRQRQATARRTLLPTRWFLSSKLEDRGAVSARIP